MQNLLQLFVIIPLAGLFVSCFLPRRQEQLLSGIALAVFGLNLAGILLLGGWWIVEGCKTLEIRQWTLYQSPKFEFFIAFLFDRVTLVFALIGAFLSLLVGVYSKYYMHRENGFKRFFCTLLLFYAGYNLLIFSGNLETLFVGWEILGITSFLLIAFYRDRYLPVKNAYKVLSFYRIGDICLMLAMWMVHQLFHRNTTFLEWSEPGLVNGLFQSHYGMAVFASLMIIVAAALKSGQLPFSSWVPRAMEGPTNSSAIFYGSLAIHSGLFVLIRTWPFWSHDWVLTSLVILTGLATSLVATGIALVQPTVKTQIAYASIAQIGLMFVEVALGWHWLALFHFAGNACLRTWQLLVSPSVLSYLVHNMFFEFQPAQPVRPQGRLTRVRQALFVLCIKEWNLDSVWHYCAWMPFKNAGVLVEKSRSRFGSLVPAGLAVVTMVLIAARLGLYLTAGSFAISSVQILLACGSVALLTGVFSGRGDARLAWREVAVSQYLMLGAMLMFEPLGWREIGLFAGGAMLALVCGYGCLDRLAAAEGSLGLDRYHGHSFEYGGQALLFLICCLAVAGFPITPTFLGIDLMFTKVAPQNILLICLMALNWLVLELALIRIYARVFLGQHKKQYHPIAYRSS